MLDFRKQGLDDVQFFAFLSSCTDLKSTQIEKICALFDLDGSGSCEFDEFFLLVCILVAKKDGCERHFLYKHWRTCFELLDADGSKSISRQEFETLGFLFGFSQTAVSKIFEDFQLDELDINDFRLFAFAALDVQESLNAKQ